MLTKFTKTPEETAHEMLRYAGTFKLDTRVPMERRAVLELIREMRKYPPSVVELSIFGPLPYGPLLEALGALAPVRDLCISVDEEHVDYLPRFAHLQAEHRFLEVHLKSHNWNSGAVLAMPESEVVIHSKCLDAVGVTQNLIRQKHPNTEYVCWQG